MRLTASCPRCRAVPVLPAPEGSASWECPLHGVVAPLWRAEQPGYDALVGHLGLAGPLPTLVPWPFPPGWRITSFGAVAGPGGPASAVFTTSTGPTDLDGVVEITVVTEEAGVGLGARCADVAHDDPGLEAVTGPPAVRIKVDDLAVPLWTLPTSGDEDQPTRDHDDGVLDRAVLVGEAGGRWLWLVLRPASAVLLLQGKAAFQDLAGMGPQLVTLPFGESPTW